MTNSNPKHGQRVVQAGALIFLLSVLLGFLVPKFALPRVGLSAHLVGVMQGLLMLTSGQLWTRLSLRPAWSRFACILTIGGGYSAWFGNVLAGAWGAGGTLLPQAAGSARGSEFKEMVLVLLLRGGGLALVVGWLVILWGLYLKPGHTSKRGLECRS